jgi:uncharacterized protein
MDFLLQRSNGRDGGVMSKALARHHRAQRAGDRLARRVHECRRHTDRRHAPEDVMRIAITGGTGLVGSALRSHFAARGDDVLVITRSPRADRTSDIGWDPQNGRIDAASLDGVDVVINLAGESIAGIWTRSRKRRIRESRVRGTTLIAETLARLQQKPHVLLSASGMNYYGDTGGQPVTETDGRGTGFMADVAAQWEAATAPAEAAGIRVVHTRFANVLSPDGGMLEAFLPVFRLGLGARFGSGRACWPWVALGEMPFVMDHLITHEEISGPVNVVAPERTTNEEFTRTLGDVLRRPTLLTIPAFLARLAPGGMADELLLGGACLQPAVLLRSGYVFRQPMLREALAAMLQPPRRGGAAAGRRH